MLSIKEVRDVVTGNNGSIRNRIGGEELQEDYKTVFKSFLSSKRLFRWWIETRATLV